jgi:hypothetical protein
MQGPSRVWRSCFSRCIASLFGCGLGGIDTVDWGGPAALLASRPKLSSSASDVWVSPYGRCGVTSSSRIHPLHLGALARRAQRTTAITRRSHCGTARRPPSSSPAAVASSMIDQSGSIGRRIGEAERGRGKTNKSYQGQHRRTILRSVVPKAFALPVQLEPGFRADPGVAVDARYVPSSSNSAQTCLGGWS